jgi:hypothetical protein
MSKQIKNIFSDTACPSQETMFRYVDNLLAGEEKHAFERHLAGCSLCADALDGLSMLKKSEADEDVAALHFRIDQYVKADSNSYWAWGIAASVSMLLIAGSWAYLHQNNEKNVAVETEVVKPVTVPETKPSIATAETSVDSMTVEPADKTIALSNEKLEEKNITSDAGTILQPKVNEEVLLKPNQAPVEAPAPQPQLSYREKTRSANNASGAVNSPEMVMEQETVVQKKSSMDQDQDQEVATSPGIASQMLAFEESIISGNQEIQKENVSPASSMSNKAANSPSRAASPAQPYQKNEERKKTKTMDGCKNCPDKEISQSAAQDMQELTYDYAVRKFNEKSYADAHLKFDQYIKENPDSYQTGSSRIYDAICLIYQNRPDEALARLNELNGSKDFADDAKWLKAAIYIDQDKLNEAKILLKELQKNKSYKEKAAKAIEDLR